MYSSKYKAIVIWSVLYGKLEVERKWAHTLKVVLEVMAQAISMFLVHMRDDALLGRILGGGHICDL